MGILAIVSHCTAWSSYVDECSVAACALYVLSPLPLSPSLSVPLLLSPTPTRCKLSAALLLGSAGIARLVGRGEARRGAARHGELHACVISRLVAQGSSNCSELQWYCLVQLGLGKKEGAPLLFLTRQTGLSIKKGLRARASLPGSNALKLHCTAAACGGCGGARHGFDPPSGPPN